jgi:predicted DCC family thiol-disulfide oxidoreductase YuxK
LSRKGVSVVLYDRDCGFCRWSADRILAWDRARRLRAVAIQSVEGARLLAALDPDARLGSWHLVDADGRLHSGGAAAEPLARLLPGGQPLASLFAVFPGLTARAYTFVARHRALWARVLRIDAACDVRQR